MTKFDINRFEADFYSMLYKHNQLDIPALDRKFLYNGRVLRVVMDSSRIRYVFDISHGITLYGGITA